MGNYTSSKIGGLLKDKVKSLGLWLSTDPELSASLNYNEKLEKVKEI